MLTAHNLAKSFSSRRAVVDFNLQIAPGEIYGLVGSDGAGKTTTLRLLCGALRLDAGQVQVCGYDIQTQTEQARQQIGYLSQRFSLYEDLTVLENIRFFAELRGLQAGEWLPRALENLEFVGLAEFKDRFAGQLSGGMKQKLGLATALVGRPRLLLLDEPTTGVDPTTRQDFWQLIIKLVNQPDAAISLLVTTPYMDEAARCHRVGFMKNGRLVTEGTPAQLLATLEAQILELRGSPLPQLRRQVSETPGVCDVQVFGDRLHLRVQPGQARAVIKALRGRIRAAGGALESLNLVPPNLEDVFIALTQDD